MEKVKDPVCGMSVDPAKAAAVSTHEGKTVSFCNVACRRKFDQDPGRYQR